MKNFQQTPKQRRVEVQKAKHKLATSKPIKQFTQVYRYTWGFGYLNNEVHHVDRRL